MLGNDWGLLRVVRKSLPMKGTFKLTPECQKESALRKIWENTPGREELLQKPSNENGNKLYIFEGENISLCGQFT